MRLLILCIQTGVVSENVFELSSNVVGNLCMCYRVDRFFLLFWFHFIIQYIR